MTLPDEKTAPKEPISDYTSGASPLEGEDLFDVHVSKLDSYQKETRMKFLWKRALQIARGCASIMKLSHAQNKKIYLEGFKNKKNVNYLTDFMYVDP